MNRVSNKNPSAKIDDVAKAAGVSKATVSRVMNRPHLVQDYTVRKVKKAMEQLHYTPNTVAQSMRLQKTKTVGVVIPDLKNPFYSGMLCELENALRKQDYMMIICPTSGVFEEEKDHIARMMQRKVDGIFHFTYNNSREHIGDILGITDTIPFILMDESTEELQVSQVVTDGYNGVAAAVKYLVEHGHTKIGCVCSNTEAASKRTHGYLDTMKALGIPVRKEYVIPSGFAVEDGVLDAEKVLKLADKPTALVCVADSIAVGLMKGLIKGGLKIPRDIEIIGFNNSELSTIVSPSLSTIGQKMTELSEQAVKMMMEMIDTPYKNRHVNIVKVEAELILRSTTKKHGKK